MVCYCLSQKRIVSVQVHEPLALMLCITQRSAFFYYCLLSGRSQEHENKVKVQSVNHLNHKSSRGRLRELLITKFM